MTSSWSAASRTRPARSAGSRACSATPTAFPPGLVWPTLTFTGKMTLCLGKLEVQILQLGRGHTKGDTIAWLPEQKILFAGDLVEYQSTPYCGDAYFRDWPTTLDALSG
ncbi:hypothetical protein NY997_13090, partial [Escherichia coli]|nr:hypothetical protein [Escherichia coli]